MWLLWLLHKMSGLIWCTNKFCLHRVLAAAFLLIITVTSCEKHPNAVHTELWRRKLLKHKAALPRRETRLNILKHMRGEWNTMFWARSIFLHGLSSTFLPDDNFVSFYKYTVVSSRAKYWKPEQCDPTISNSNFCISEALKSNLGINIPTSSPCWYFQRNSEHIDAY